MSRNIIEVDPKKFPWLDLQRYTFCMAVESNGLIYLSGQTASAYYETEGRVICKGDLLEQTRLIYEKLGVVLEAAGLSFQNVVQTVDYVDPVGLPQYRQTGDIRKEFLGDTPVASTGICVERLLRPDALIEVNAVATIDEKRVIDPGWARYQQLTYAPAIEAGDVIWLSGFIGSEEVDGKRIYPQDTAQQTALAYKSIGEVLQAGDAQPGDIVNSLDYVSPQAILQYSNTDAVRSKFYGDQYPAATGIVANRLLSPYGHVEVETVAVKGGSREEIRIAQWEGRYSRLTHVAGIKKGRLLYISGQSSVDHTTNENIGGFDMAAQADQIYSNIAQVLNTAGYSMNDVVNTIEWVAPNGLMGYRGVQEVRRKHFGDNFPAATGVIIHRMLRPELLMEVSALAVV